ncbi:hypothetical protein SRHO_G00045130 [Serrasalmus rhombeus]
MSITLSIPFLSPSLIHGTGSTPSTDVRKRHVDPKVTVGGFSSHRHGIQQPAWRSAALLYKLTCPGLHTPGTDPGVSCKSSMKTRLYSWLRSCLINGSALLKSQTQLNSESL